MATSTQLDIGDNEKIYLLWRCSDESCREAHIRTIRGRVWKRYDVQSPCPKCKQNGTPRRTRLNNGNVRIYRDKSTAIDALDLIRGMIL